MMRNAQSSFTLLPKVVGKPALFILFCRIIVCLFCIQELLFAIARDKLFLCTLTFNLFTQTLCPDISQTISEFKKPSLWLLYKLWTSSQNRMVWLFLWPVLRPCCTNSIHAKVYDLKCDKPFAILMWFLSFGFEIAQIFDDIGGFVFLLLPAIRCGVVDHVCSINMRF